MPDPHYVDTVAEDHRDEIRRLEAENERLRFRVADLLTLVDGLRSQVARMRAGGRA